MAQRIQLYFVHEVSLSLRAQIEHRPWTQVFLPSLWRMKSCRRTIANGQGWAGGNRHQFGRWTPDRRRDSKRLGKGVRADANFQKARSAM